MDYLELSQLQETVSSQARDLEKANKVSRRPCHQYSELTLYAGFAEEQES